MAVQVDTGRVLATADTIARENKYLRDSYDEIDEIVAGLKNHWSGDACDMCCRISDKIKNTFKEQRYALVNDYVRFLRSQVIEGYEQTETTVSKAADAFK